MGRRVQKTVYAYGAGEWQVQKEVLFVYDGWNLVKETTIPDGGSAVDKYYVWGLDLSQSLQGAGGVGGLLAVVDGSLTYQYFCDANGNVGQVIKADDGSIAAHYEYDPFGNLVNQAGDYADENPYRFSTKYFDFETDLYYYGYRYYDSGFGRWLNRDPVGEYGGENQYSFVFNSTTNFCDLLGLLQRTPLPTKFPTPTKVKPKVPKTPLGAILLYTLTLQGSVADNVNPAKDADLNPELFPYYKADPKDKTDDDDINQMGLQLQQKRNHLWGMHIKGRNSTGGVTVVMMISLADHLRYEYDKKLISGISHSKKTKCEFDKALNKMEKLIRGYPSGGGVIKGGNVGRQLFVGSDKKTYRIDLENDRGHNLRW